MTDVRGQISEDRRQTTDIGVNVLKLKSYLISVLCSLTSDLCFLTSDH
jgi:hypothetical protein